MNRSTVTVAAAPILREWGGPTVPQTRRDNGNVPLVFDARAVINRRTLRGRGLVECVAARRSAPTAGPGIQR